MELLLEREHFGQYSTIGSLYVDGVKICFVLEDVCRDEAVTKLPFVKIAKYTAIPAGEYLVVLDYSPRFKTELPHIVTMAHSDRLPCPDGNSFSGVRIHAGNTAADTEGCLLPGLIKGVDIVYNSGPALSDLFVKLRNAGGHDVRLTIVNKVKE